jgi:putative N6-adenine-specific DNA methylase
MQEYFAVAALGIEPATAAELARLGAGSIRPVAGGVHFEADLATLYRACLWLRTPSRILRPLREFAAISAEMLYSQTRRVRWEDYLNPTRTPAVQATIAGSAARRQGGKPPGAGKNRPARGDDRSRPPKGIHHSMFAALKIKDAIVDRLRREQGARPNVDRENPDVLVHAHFSGGRCSLSLDAIGSSLHERGYRTQSAAAPLKENLAAAILELIGWDGQVPLHDPMCGSGTLVIEAALKALRIAPGLSRERFACQRWPDFDGALWQKEFDETRRQKLSQPPCPIAGTDADPSAIRIAETHARRAGVGHAIQFQSQPFEETRPPAAEPGVIVTNPPYGERLGDVTELAALYRTLGELLPRRFPGWTAWILAGNLSLARHIGLVATEKIKLFNGPIPCRLLKFAPGAIDNAEPAG